MTSWSTPADVRARVMRRWEDGSILRALAAGSPFPTVHVALHGPRPREIGEDLEAVRSWIAALETGSQGGKRYSVSYAAVGGRLIGRNELPHRALIESYEQAAALLGVGDRIRAFRAVLSVVAPEEEVSAWVRANPLPALDVAELWPTMLSAYKWLRDSRDSGRYLREIAAPGVDTKFIERHRALLAQLLGVPSTVTGFLTALGLRTKPEMLRLRHDHSIGLSSGLTDLTVRVDELARLELRPKSALVIENEITFLSVPVPAEGVVLWGKGFEVDRVGSMPWLGDAEINYWGDLDTHGFAILNRLRGWLPHTRSLMMDRETLVAHRDRWGTETSPSVAHLDRLTDEEQILYQDLVTDRFTEHLRLEQERLDWNWVTERLLR